MTTTDQVRKIKELAANYRNLLPMYGKADVTLIVETPDEVKHISRAMGKLYIKPSPILPYYWFQYTDGPVKISVQTEEQEVTENERYHLNNN